MKSFTTSKLLTCTLALFFFSSGFIESHGFLLGSVTKARWFKAKLTSFRNKRCIVNVEPSFRSIDSLNNSLHGAESHSSMEKRREPPATKDLIHFMLPVFAMFLANPLLSAVDTAAVGTWCERRSLAALGPATGLLC